MSANESSVRFDATSKSSAGLRFDVEPVTLPVKLERQEHDDRYGYRIEQPVGVRLGAGGPTFTFASLNGDVRIRKNK
jgi:hypothetical protein